MTSDGCQSHARQDQQTMRKTDAKTVKTESINSRNGQDIPVSTPVRPRKTWPLKSKPVFRPLFYRNLASHQ